MKKTNKKLLLGLIGAMLVFAISTATTTYFICTYEDSEIKCETVEKVSDGNDNEVVITTQLFGIPNVEDVELPCSYCEEIHSMSEGNVSIENVEEVSFDGDPSMYEIHGDLNVE